MYTIFQKNTGVTLIELIVVMAILGIMASITTISFGSSRDKRAVETNARQFAAVVRLAQNYALSGKRAPGVTTPTCGYQVSNNGSAYFIKALKIGASGACDADPVISESYTLNQGVAMTIATDVVSFEIPYGKKSGASSFTFSKGASSHYVCINTKGEVKDSPTAGCR